VNGQVGRRGRLVVSAALTASVLAGLAACGGTSADDAAKMQLAKDIVASANANLRRATSMPSAPVEQAFLERANAICQPVLDYNASHPNPYPSFDYNHPDAATLKLEGAFFNASPFLGALNKIISLGSPQQNAGTWQTLVTTATELRSVVEAQNQAAAAGNVTAFTATLAPINRLTGSSGTLAGDLNQTGFSTGSPCRQMLTGS
jgi:hypothetical protein